MVFSVVLLSCILGIFLFLPLIGSFLIDDSEQLTRKKLGLASMIDFWNSRYEYYLGSLSYFGKDVDNYHESIRHYRNALQLNANHLYSWFSLAKAYWMDGDRDEAMRIFDRLAEVNTMNRNISWDAGVFLLTKGEELRALKHLRRYLILEPHMYEHVFSMCIEAGISHENISRDLLGRDANLLDLYYTFLMKNNMLDVLDAILDLGLLDKSQNRVHLKICNSLIGNGFFKKAREVATVLSGDISVGKLTNGGFEDEMIHGCFGWRIFHGKGFTAKTDEDVSYSGQRSYEVAFDGSRNVSNILFSQIVLVEPGKEYIISARAKSENITTTNGVYIDAGGYGCNMTRSRSEEVRGTRDWRELRVHCKVPEGCVAVVVSVRRDRSNKLNNKIAGTIWFDDIAIEELN